MLTVTTLFLSILNNCNVSLYGVGNFSYEIQNITTNSAALLCALLRFKLLHRFIINYAYLLSYRDNQITDVDRALLLCSPATSYPIPQNDLLYLVNSRDEFLTISAIRFSETNNCNTCSIGD